MTELPSPTTLAIPAFTTLVLLEWWMVRIGRASGKYENRDAIVSILMGLGNVVVGALTASVSLYMMLIFWDENRASVPLNFWTLTLLFIAYDFIYYWKHRAAHRVRWFWAEHSTHHSSQFYNLTTALRQPWFGPFTGLFLFSVPLVLIGFHPLAVFFVAGLNLVYQFWIHTEAIDRMPSWFEAVFNTPSHHRVHHATNPKYLDRNYAGVFIIWDRMFGTFEPETADAPPVYGMVKQLETYNSVRVAFQEFSSMMSDCRSDGLRPDLWIRRLTSPPGWSSDGNHQRSEDLRRAQGSVTSEFDQ